MAIAKKTFKKGENVSWKSSQGKIEGTIVKKVVSKTRVKGFTAKPTAKKPEYEVKSSKTGKKAVHKPEQLSKSK